MDDLTPEEEAELAAYDAEDAQAAMSDLTPEEQAELVAYEEEEAADQAFADATLAADAAGPREGYEADYSDSLLGGAAQGASLGFADEAAGAVAAGTEAVGDAGGAFMDYVKGDAPVEDFYRSVTPESLGETYTGTRDEIREGMDRLYEANPKTFIGGEVAGALATSLAAPGSAAAQEATLARNLGIAGAEGAATGLGLSEEESLAGLAQDTALGAGLGVAGGAIGSKIAKGTGKVNQYLASKFDDLASSQKQKSIGLMDTLGMRKELNKFLAKGKVGEYEIGKTLREEGVGGAFTGTKGLVKQLRKSKAEIGEEIGEQIEAARPVSSGALRRNLENTLGDVDDISTPDIRINTHIENVIKRIKSKEGAAAEGLPRLREELMDQRISLTNQEKLGLSYNRSDIEGLDKAIAALDTEIANTEVFIPARRIAKSKSRLGKNIKNFNDPAGSREALVKEYKASAEALTNVVPDAEKFKQLNKKYEIAKLLEGAAERKAAGPNDAVGDLYIMHGIGHDDKRALATGLIRKIWNRTGNAGMASVFGGVHQLAKLPGNSILILAKAAERGGAPAVAASHHILIQSDPEYRKQFTENMEKSKDETANTPVPINGSN